MADPGLNLVGAIWQRVERAGMSRRRCSLDDGAEIMAGPSRPKRQGETMLDWFSRLSPSVAAALVSLLVTVLTLVVSVLVGPSVKFAFDKRLKGQKLELAYRWEQRKALKDHIARHRGIFLESAEALAQRLWNYQENESRGR